MEQIVFHWLESVMGSPLIYPLLASVTLGDAVAPIIPGELPMNIAGAYSGIFGFPNLYLIMLFCGVGAVIGDNLCFVLGRKLTPAFGYLRRRRRLKRALNWANENLSRRDASVIIIARFIPGARWVVTVMLGSSGYSHLRFALFDTLGVAIWAIQGTLFGYVGGWLFKDYPIIGIAAGLVFGVASGLLVEKLSRSVTHSSVDHWI